LSTMFRRLLKWFLGILAVAVLIVALFLINLIWFRPWSLNLFYEKVFVQVIFDEPELFSSLGLVEQFGITSHNGKLSDESPAHQQKVFERWKRDLADLRAYPLDTCAKRPVWVKKEVTAEIERYIVSPAQACADKVGDVEDSGIARAGRAGTENEIRSA